MDKLHNSNTALKLPQTYYWHLLQIPRTYWPTYTHHDQYTCDKLISAIANIGYYKGFYVVSDPEFLTPYLYFLNKTVVSLLGLLNIACLFN